VQQMLSVQKQVFSSIYHFVILFCCYHNLLLLCYVYDLNSIAGLSLQITDHVGIEGALVSLEAS
jgi:hypothetical protein